MYRNFIHQTSALALLLGLACYPAVNPAHADDRNCNVLLDGDGEPVRESDSDAVGHSNSYACDSDDTKNETYSNEDASATEPQQEVAAVTPAPTPVLRPLTVYFDVSSDSLSPGGSAQVQDFADQLLAAAPDSIQVAGYTDTSGSPALNKRLSKARAANVIAALIGAGLPARMISQDAKGEESLAVSTPDATREPNNRRVTITPVY